MKYDDLAYDGVQPFGFVSYSHADMARVEYLIRVLRRGGVRVWYDAGIGTGERWSEIIDQKITESSCFLLALSNGGEQREEIIREIKAALRRQQQDPAYRIITLLLEPVPLAHVFEREPELLCYFSQTQYIDLGRQGGVTMRFLRSFLSTRIWPSCVMDKELRADLVGLEADSDELLPDFLEDLRIDNQYIYPKAFPILREEDGVLFYRLLPGQTDPSAVIPICLDNQWCPVAFYEDPQFQRNGFSDPELMAQREEIQKRELFRILLHNWQMILNRAYVYNTHLFSQWYTDAPQAEQAAFLELMENGSIVLYLLKERHPAMRPGKFETYGAVWRRWEALCKNHRFYCLRLDWDDTENQYEIARRITYRFRELLMTAADDRYRLEMLQQAFRIPPEREEAFRNLWKRIRNRTIAYSRKEIRDYSREMVYRDFLLQPGTPTPQCVLDPEKPFTRELKQTLDFYYGVNLPAALGIRPAVPRDNPLSHLFFSDELRKQDHRIISQEELYCAVMLFRPDFLEAMPVARREPDLSEVAIIRAQERWREYQRAVDAGRKRANLNEVDFRDMERVWIAFRGLMQICRQKLPELDWQEAEGCLSVIYRIGSQTVKAVYRAGSPACEICAEEEPGAERAKLGFTIDFVCADVLHTDVSQTSFYTELRLFEGAAAQSGTEMKQVLLRALRREPMEEEMRGGQA